MSADLTNLTKKEIRELKKKIRLAKRQKLRNQGARVGRRTKAEVKERERRMDLAMNKPVKTRAFEMTRLSREPVQRTRIVKIERKDHRGAVAAFHLVTCKCGFSYRGLLPKKNPKRLFFDGKCINCGKRLHFEKDKFQGYYVNAQTRAFAGSVHG